MAKRRYPPHHDHIDEGELTVTEPEDHAAGVKAVAVSMNRALQHMGPARTARTLLELNQTDGFDCMLRSHDQYNTTIYGLSDRYRGIEGGRRVVMMNRDDISQRGFQDGDLVDLITHWPGDSHVRRAASFRIVGYQTPRGSAAAYYPETNPLVPLDSTALGSNTPASKSVVIRLERSGMPPVLDDSQEPVGADDEHKRYPQPEYLS